MSAYNPDAIVYDFFTDQGGELFLVSDDDFFIKNVRTVFQKTLALKNLHMEHHRTLQSGLRAVLDSARENIVPMVMVERIINGQSSADFIRAVTGSVPGTKVLCLTDETERDVAAFMHELGAGGILTKPASANDIIAKAASLVKPPHKLSMLLGKARQFMNQGRYEAAIELCEKVMEIKPDSSGMLMIKGESLIGLDRFDEGVKALVAAHESAPMYLDPLIKLVEVHTGVNDRERLHWLRKLDSISPRNLRRKYDLGRVSARLGEIEKAEEYFNAALSLARTESPAILNQVAIDISEVVPEEAMDMGQRILSETLRFKGSKVSGSDMPLFNRLGLNLRRQGKWEEAVKCYQRALEIAPNDEGLHYNIAMAFYEGGQLRDALAQLQRALELNPGLGSQSRNITANIGHIFQAAGRNAEAISYLEHALELAPGDKALISALASARRAAA